MNCLYDNKVIKRTSHPGVPQKYCNSSCRNKYYYRHGGAEKKKAYRENRLSLTNHERKRMTAKERVLQKYPDAWSFYDVLRNEWCILITDKVIRLGEWCATEGGAWKSADKLTNERENK